ncbi:MAG: hypothetical protein AB7O97_24380 [Planctomycetota bacterium]
MTRTSTLLLTAALAAAPLWTPCGGACAQDDAPADNGSPHGIQVTVTFAGGSLAEFLDLVRQQDRRINIVASDLARQVEVPAITMLDTSVPAALEAITSVLPEGYKARANVSRGPVGNPVYVVQVESRRSRDDGAVAVQVYSLATLTQTLPDDPKEHAIALPARTVLSAVEAATGVLGGQPELRYHEDSQLLFVRGSQTELALVRDVLGSLENQQAVLRRKLRDAESQRTAGDGKVGQSGSDAGAGDRGR